MDVPQVKNFRYLPFPREKGVGQFKNDMICSPNFGDFRIKKDFKRFLVEKLK
jgi:hypothetical protein